MIPLLLSLATVTVFSKVTSKTCSNVVAARNNRIRYLLYLTIVGIIACGIFFIMNGFKIGVTPKTLYYALAYTGVCVLSVICNLEILKLANIAGVVVLSTFGSLIATSAVGFFIFDEEISPRTLIKIFIMFIPAILTFLETKEKKGSEEKKQNKKLLKLTVIILTLVAVGCGNVTIIKLYGTASGVTDFNSMFFFTNLIQGIGAILLLGFFCIKSKRTEKGIEHLDNAKEILKPLPLLVMVGNTLASNLNSIISAKLIKIMDLSLFTPVSSAITILAGVVASFIYRERHGVWFYISAVFALLAVII